MMIVSPFVIGFAFLPWALAVPRPFPNANTIHVPIVRHNPAPRPKVVDVARQKHGTADRRWSNGRGDLPVADVDDETYSGIVSIGIPPQEFNLQLDTGSTYLWFASTACTSVQCASGIPLFNPSNSSTYQNDSSPFNITYGSGFVAGYISSDTVTFAGFTLPDQPFLSVDSTAGNAIAYNFTSGIMGLGISGPPLTPFWLVLYEQGMLLQPMFAFYLERHIGEQGITPGGTFTLGGTNRSLYRGEIEYFPMPNGTTPSYWYQQIKTVTVQGTTIDIPSNESLAVIDTGTTTMLAPAPIAAEIWSQVPGSMALTGEYEGRWGFPCTTNISISISFGGTAWSIDPADMNINTVELPSGEMCIGGIASRNGATHPWVIGDIFLRNVYSVFRADPPSVGFARLQRDRSG